MITDPIPSVKAQQAIDAIIVASYADATVGFVHTFATANSRFRGISWDYNFSQLAEIGTHWHIVGEWDRDDNLGDVFRIASAALSLAHGADIQVWLQYNILGMGSWYPRQLWRAFGNELPLLLRTFQYETLLKVVGKNLQVPYRALTDACTAWAEYERDMAIASQFVDPLFQCLALQANAVFDHKALASLQFNSHQFSIFTTFAQINEALLHSSTEDEGDSRRLLAGVDSMIAKHFAAGRLHISRRMLEYDLERLLHYSSHVASQTVDLAIRKGNIFPLHGGYIEGARTRFLQQSLANFILDRHRREASLATPTTAEELTEFIARRASCAAELSFIFLPFGGVYPDQTALNDPRLDMVHWVTRDTSRLRSQFRNLGGRILSPREFSTRDCSWPHQPPSFILSEAFTYTISQWIEIFHALPKEAHIFLCGPEFHTQSLDSPWTQISHGLGQVSRAKITLQQCGLPPFRALENALSTCSVLTARPYEAADNIGFSSLDLPTQECLEAVVGISYQLQRRNFSVQIFCPEQGLCADINIRAQNAMQQVRPSVGRRIGTSTFFEGDPVVQTALWENSLATNSLARVKKVYPQAEVFRRHDGRVERVHVEVCQDEVLYQLTQAQVGSLQLAYALAANFENTTGVDAVIIITSSFADLEPTYL